MHDPLSGVRVGEAKKPGPPQMYQAGISALGSSRPQSFRFVHANIIKLNEKRLPNISAFADAYDVPLLCLTDHRVDDISTELRNTELGQFGGWDCV